jgi:uncharacterized protein
MRFNFSILVAGVIFLNTTPSRAASFACDKAVTPTEKAICTNAKLSELDEHLARYYSLALEELGDGAPCLKLDQRQWAQTTRKSCAAKTDCLEAAYLKRLSTLDGLQPGANALKNIELPNAPSLVAAILPESTGSPSNGKTLEWRGHLLLENNDRNNMGYAIKSSDGQSHVFVLDIDIGNSNAHKIVANLIETEAATEFLVRGTNANGGFSSQKCRMVYRVR